MTAPRVLTFNFHEPYLCLMAKTGLPLTVGTYAQPPLARPWVTQFRPIPKNITLLDEALWRPELERGRFDVVIAHNETNASDIAKAVLQSRTPMLLVCHNRRTFLETTLTSVKGDPREEYRRLLEHLQEIAQFVFISESKRADYGLPGCVILPGMDVEEYGGYVGTVRQVLRVGNMMRDRNLMFDVDFQEMVCEGLPHRVVGVDPKIAAAQPAESFDQLLCLYRTLRCLLHVTREEYEDGYNLSMLEAMACGMPVVSLANRTSPLTDGVNGFLSSDACVLRGRLCELLDDLDLAREIGARGRETVARTFPLEPFVSNWRQVIEEAARRGSGKRRVGATRPTRTERPVGQEQRFKILLEYVATPTTTGRYLEQALRKRHDVVTVGAHYPQESLPSWGFAGRAPENRPHDITMPFTATLDDLLAKLPGPFRPDIYWWVDSGPKATAPYVDQLDAVKVCYLIDTHLAPDIRLEIARHFDFVFLAQKPHVAEFARSGIAQARWAPLACSPELHEVGSYERIYDVAFVGKLEAEWDDRRRRLIGAIQKRFPNSRIGKFWPAEMARIYAQAKIVVNACANRDLNMRVFEALASGALLITEEAAGLEDLFEEGRHLVIYRTDDEALDLIERYLSDQEARERIAAQGCALVREKHTYDKRLEEMLLAVTALSNVPSLTSAGEPHVSPYYLTVRPELAQYVPLWARRILDCGCAAGGFGSLLKTLGVEEVVGVEINEKAHVLASQVLDRAFLGNVETIELPYGEGYFDCICFGDVLEHLVEPAAALRKYARWLAPNGVMVISFPNVAFCGVFAMLGQGRWSYEDAGILDRTHLRFFTKTDMAETLRAAGLIPVGMKPLSGLSPEALLRNSDGSVTCGRVTLTNVTDEEYESLRTAQYVVVAAKPGADLLEPARRALDSNRNDAAYKLADTAFGGNQGERKAIMAKAAARMDQLEKAESLYREALALRPEEARWAGELGIVLVAMNRVKDAEPYLRTANRAEPDNARVMAALALVELARGRQGDAFDRFRMALEMDFHNAALIRRLAAAAQELSRESEAEPILRRYVDFYPGDAEVGCLYAETLYRLGRLQEAQDRLDTLLLFDSDNYRARKLLEKVRQGMQSCTD